ncbi:MAG: vWA domain-containing protein [Prevotella sp.]|nr:VWA domain-containing protein [Prevotellaceae bacterium]MDY5125377.1 vWA domain-containing protein [Prevotella sp.]MDY5250575.1 vWA domain-containing protein [Prevotella sp.]
MKRVFNLIVVDESGSMCVIEKQALAGLNETIQTVKKVQDAHPDMEQHITIMTFDSGHKRYIYDNVLAKDATMLSKKDYNPGGATPLYDAVGIAISRLNAITTDDDHVLMTIITDGEENCSTEYSLNMIKTLIEKLKKHNWTFSFIGTDNLDVESMAKEMNIDNHLTFTEDAEGTAEMFATERACRMSFMHNIFAGHAIGKGSYFNSDNNDDNKQ